MKPCYVKALQRHGRLRIDVTPANPRPVCELDRFSKSATAEELGMLRGFAPSEQFVVKPLDTGARPKSMITPAQIIERVARYYHLKPAQLVGYSRYRQTAQARMVAVYLVRDRFDAMSLSGIGAYFSHRDHSTIIHAIKTIRSRLQTDFMLREQMNDLAALIDSAPEMPALVDV